MRKRVLLLGVLGVLLLGVVVRAPQPGGAPWTAEQRAFLASSIDRALHDPILAGAQTGVDIVDTTRGTTLYASNAQQEFMPASNFKLIVGSTALASLPSTFDYTTSVLASAAPADGTIAGDLYLRGGGDASLSERDLDAAAARLAAMGVRRIDGALVADASLYDDVRYPSGWEWDDLPYYFAPVVSALELDDGITHVTVAPSAVGAPVVVRAWPATSAFTIENAIRTGMPDSADTTDIARPWDAPRTILLTGSYPQGAGVSGDFAPAVPDPAAYALDVFARALAAQGITLAAGEREGTAPPGCIVLWEHHSAALPQLIANMWLPSDNLMAELLLKALGVAQAGKPGTTAAGIARERQYLSSIGIDPASLDIRDGSGLSIYDRVTPADLVALLQADWNGPHRQAVLDALPIAGVRGTLDEAYRGTAAEGAVFAKSGTMTHVTTLSGYVETRTHGAVTFSLMINQWLPDKTVLGHQQLARLRGAIFSAIAAS